MVKGDLPLPHLAPGWVMNGRPLLLLNRRSEMYLHLEVHSPCDSASVTRRPPAPALCKSEANCSEGLMAILIHQGVAPGSFLGGPVVTRGHFAEDLQKSHTGLTLLKENSREQNLIA